LAVHTGVASLRSPKRQAISFGPTPATHHVDENCLGTYEMDI